MLTREHSLIAYAKRGDFAGFTSLLSEEAHDFDVSLVCVSDEKYGRTCLHWASHNGHTNIVRHLIATREASISMTLDLDVKDSKGMTPLMLAAKMTKFDVARLLVSSGSDIDLIDDSGNTANQFTNNKVMCNILLERPIHRRLQPLPTTEISIRQDSSSQFSWGLKGCSLDSAAAQGKGKCISAAWYHRMGAGLQRNAEVVVEQDVIAKLSIVKQEMDWELHVRTKLMQFEIDSVSGCGDRAIEKYFVACKESGVVQFIFRDVCWFGLLLEKGAFDLHALLVRAHRDRSGPLSANPIKISDMQETVNLTEYPPSSNCTSSSLKQNLIPQIPLPCTHYKCMESTKTRLMIKLKIASKVIEVCSKLDSAGFVWFDMKPSNLIAFSTKPSSSDGSRKERRAMERFPIQHTSFVEEDFLLKGTDFLSCHEIGKIVDPKSLSCTAKFVAPEVARFVIENSYFRAESFHHVWALGLSLLQILDPKFESIFKKIGLLTSEDIYSFYSSNTDEAIQSILDPHINSTLDSVFKSCQFGCHSEVCLGETHGVLYHNLFTICCVIVTGSLSVDKKARISFQDLENLRNDLVGNLATFSKVNIEV